MIVMVFAIGAALHIAGGISFAAIGCSLNDPDRDIKKFFPRSTGYRTEFITMQERGGQRLKEEVERTLGDTLDPLYESLDVPYSYYRILRGKEVIGYMHGVNQKGMYGTLQIILATDPTGTIIGCYYQKIASPEAAKFRESSFAGQFIGLSLADFLNSSGASGRVAAIKDPTMNNHRDFTATIRGIKKNLILLDEFILSAKKVTENTKAGAR